MEIITGYTGKPHVTAEQDRDVNEGIFDTGSFVLKTGSQLAAELVSNNEIKIRDGVLVIQGCAAVIKKNTYDPVTIANGSQGMKRIDLIVARYNKNEETKIEEVTRKVIQGTPNASTAAVPTYKTGDIQSGDLGADMPLYKVTLDGLNVTSVDKMFMVIPTLPELNSNLKSVNDNLTTIKKCNITLSSSNVSTKDSWITCYKIGKMVMVKGKVKITKNAASYSGIKIATGLPLSCDGGRVTSPPILIDGDYSSCFLEMFGTNEMQISVRHKQVSANSTFYFQFCYICV